MWSTGDLGQHMWDTRVLSLSSLWGNTCVEHGRCGGAAHGIREMWRGSGEGQHKGQLEARNEWAWPDIVALLQERNNR